MLAGGDTDLFDLHSKAMQAMGDRIFHMGPVGSASIIKVITNMLAFIHLKATSEALMLAKRGGLDLAQAWHAIQASSGNSFVDTAPQEQSTEQLPKLEDEEFYWASRFDPSHYVSRQAIDENAAIWSSSGLMDT